MTVLPQMIAAQPQATSLPDKSESIEVLSFELAGMDFCLPIFPVREIRTWSPPTPLPRSDPALLGVINLRGAILPVIDLACHLGLSPRGSSAVIIVIEVENHLAGLAVDRVTDLVTYPANALSPPPAVGEFAVARSLLGLILTPEGCLRVLDAAHLIPARNSGAPG
ncbi:MAG: chemotaxis protein CheW [Rhodobacteraceae bacterium]|nr:chemotaxis protein CheW [Paracoccaceae bacterium]